MLIIASGSPLASAAEGPPTVARIEGSAVTLPDGAHLAAGERRGNWTLVTVAPVDANGTVAAIFEDFSTVDGTLAMVAPGGPPVLLRKTAEPTAVDPANLYRGHRLEDVKGSDHDLLGAEILARPGDPDYATVAACLAPLTKFETYSFVGTPGNPDKVGVAYGGRTGNFDPAVYVPAIRQLRADGKVLDGLLGDWLPVLRFVYPESAGTWTEMLLFAPERLDEANPRIQPVWYRLARIEGGRLAWIRYFDSYNPYAPRTDVSAPGTYYADLAELRRHWRAELAGGMTVDLPDPRLADQARHSLVRAAMTRIGAFPKYGVLDRNYGGAEHDGFPDTLNVDVTAMLAWGQFARAREYLDNYFTHFVRDDGSLLYRGPEIGQYGRMLTVAAEYADLTGDTALLRKHRGRIDAIARLLLGLQRQAQALPAASPAHGLIAGWCEADSCLETDPGRYVQPYLSNSAEAARGFRDLGRTWARIGQVEKDATLANWGGELQAAATTLSSDLQAAITRSWLREGDQTWLPAIAGAPDLPHVAAQRDGSDPQFRAYRAYMELLFSGLLTTGQAGSIYRYRESHRDLILGVPLAYGYNTGEMAGFLGYGHAFGLLQHDFVREYLLELYALSAHQYTRGHWTAPETRRISPADLAAPYCVPAQLTVPLLVRWMLAFEDPASGVLWLGKALPREWLAAGKVVAADAIPTRWGPVALRLESRLTENQIDAQVTLPPVHGARQVVLRLRVPNDKVLRRVRLNGQPWAGFDPAAETITLPADAAGHLQIRAEY